MQIQQNIWGDENLINVLENGGVAVIPTDTIYGIVGQAINKSTVLRIYEIKKRVPDKPCIVLIGNIKELKKFSIILSEKQKDIINNFSIPTSFILDCTDEKFSYLHRGTKTLAFRLPIQKELKDLLLKVGPLVAPSANIEGMSPAENITKAKEYFGDLVDLYVDGGEISGKASRVIKLNKDGSIFVIRE